MTLLDDLITTANNALDLLEAALENYGGNMATQEEIKNAIIQALEEGASRFLSGQGGNVLGGISIDADGNITVTPPGAAPDDPATGLDENRGARAGGAKAIATGLQELVNNMFNWYVANATIPKAAAQTRLQLLYGFDETAASDFATYWYETYMNSQGTISFPVDTLSGKFFCKGISKASFSEYIYENHSVAAEVPVLEKLVQAIPQATLDSWFETGSKVPSIDYELYSCSPIAFEQFTLDMASADTPQYTTNGVWKAGHRYLIEVSGTYTDTDNANLTGDGMYRVNATDGAKTFNSLNFNFGSVSNPTQAQVPYKANHSYSFTVEKPALSGNAAGIISKPDATMTRPNRTGTITVKITDLGEFAL